MSCNVVQMDVFARLGRARCIIRRDARDAVFASAQKRGSCSFLRMEDALINVDEFVT